MSGWIGRVVSWACVWGLGFGVGARLTLGRVEWDGVLLAEGGRRRLCPEVDLPRSPLSPRPRCSPRPRPPLPSTHRRARDRHHLCLRAGPVAREAELRRAGRVGEGRRQGKRVSRRRQPHAACPPIRTQHTHTAHTTHAHSTRKTPLPHTHAPPHVAELDARRVVVVEQRVVHLEVAVRDAVLVAVLDGGDDLDARG